LQQSQELSFVKQLKALNLMSATFSTSEKVKLISKVRSFKEEFGAKAGRQVQLEQVATCSYVFNMASLTSFSKEPDTLLKASFLVQGPW
jgi:hypothetical protein